MMLGPVSSENEGAGSGTGRVRPFSLVICACWCWRGGVVSAAGARGLPGGWPYLLQDVRVCLLEVVEGLEGSGHVLLCEVGVVLGGGVWARPQQRHEAGCTKQWTRPANKRLPSHTRIDLILSSPASNTIFKPFNTFIDIHNDISDHRPVSTSIAISTNLINIYNIPHNSIHYRPLSKEEKSHFTSLSKPLNDWLSKHHDTLFLQPVEQLIPLTD